MSETALSAGPDFFHDNPFMAGFGPAIHEFS